MQKLKLYIINALRFSNLFEPVKLLIIKILKIYYILCPNFILKGSFENKFNKKLQEIKKIDFLKDTILIHGFMLSKNKEFLNNFYKSIVNENHMNIAAIIPSPSNEREKKIFSQCIKFPIALVLPNEWKYKALIDFTLTAEDEKLISEKKYLRSAIQNIKSRNMIYGKNYVEKLAIYYYKCYLEVLKKQNVKKIIIWTEFKPSSHIFKGMCKEFNKEVLFMEFGSLPKTFVIEPQGQMGNSLISKNYDKFVKMVVTQDEINKSKVLVDNLKKGNSARYEQTKEISSEFLNLDTTQITILFAGQFDYECGLVPYTQKSKDNHSPNFRSSHECVLFLADICRKNNWNLIYRPHPLLYRDNPHIGDNLSKNIIFMPEGDLNLIIDKSDLIITIVSSVVYTASIREKPSLMLGFNQISRKGCVYEEYDKEKIEMTIKEALKHGYTKEQKHNFIKHVAQLNKYVLTQYDDESILNEQLIKK